MDQSCHTSAQRVQDALSRCGLPCSVLTLSDSTRTASDAASSIGCHVAQIVKSLIFKGQLDTKPILVLVSGRNQVNETIIEAHIGEKISKANANFVRSVTGFAIGGVPPLGHLTPIEHIYIDEHLLEQEFVWAAAGTPNAVFQIKPRDLVTATNGKIISIV